MKTGRRFNGTQNNYGGDDETLWMTREQQRHSGCWMNLLRADRAGDHMNQSELEKHANDLRTWMNERGLKIVPSGDDFAFLAPNSFGKCHAVRIDKQADDA